MEFELDNVKYRIAFAYQKHDTGKRRWMTVKSKDLPLVMPARTREVLLELEQCGGRLQLQEMIERRTVTCILERWTVTEVKSRINPASTVQTKDYHNGTVAPGWHAFVQATIKVNSDPDNKKHPHTYKREQLRQEALHACMKACSFNVGTKEQPSWMWICADGSYSFDKGFAWALRRNIWRAYSERKEIAGLKDRMRAELKKEIGFEPGQAAPTIGPGTATA